MVFTQDNMGAYMMPYQMPLTLLKWDQNQHFDQPQMFEDVICEDTATMCLTKNGESVLMNDGNKLLVFNTTSKDVTKTVEFDDCIFEIS